MSDISLTYRSHAAPQTTERVLSTLLYDARAHNESRGITGMLVFSRGGFYQTLEGEEAAVHDVMSNILQDTRHCDVEILAEIKIREREYAEWSMGFADTRFWAWRIRWNARRNRGE